MTTSSAPSTLLSVILPVYNKAGYLEKSLRSILDQDFTDYELIIIDDGSTDRSAEVIRQFEDPRIRLFTTSNQGVSAARNRGIKEAKGQFLLFLDADDYISPHYLSRIMKECGEHEADIYVWGITKEDASGKQVPVVPKVQGMLQDGEFVHETVEEQYHRHRGIMGYIPNKLLRRDFIINHGIKFDTHKKLLEDYDFYLSCYAHVHSAYFFDECGYHYVEHPPTHSSASHNVDYLSLIDTHRRCMLLTHQSIDSSCDYRRVLQAIGRLTLAMFLEMQPISYSQVSQKMSEIKRRPYCENGLRILHPKQRRLRWWLLKRSKAGVYSYLKCRKMYMGIRRNKKG